MVPEELLHHDQGLALAPVSVPGDVIENVYIPARGYLKGRKLQKGTVLRIIDLEGHQVPDVIFFDADNLKDVSSCIHTCVMHQRWKIRKGDTIYSKYCKPMAKIIEDTVGLHHFGGGFCNAELNAVRFGIEGTHTCRSNLAALKISSIVVPGGATPFITKSTSPKGGEMCATSRLTSMRTANHTGSNPRAVIMGMNRGTVIIIIMATASMRHPRTKPSHLFSR